jgi:hypothetical protein
MKKLILSVTALAACSVGAFAQGTIVFDGSSATAPGGQVTINGALNTTININAELLYSSTQGGTYSPVAMLLLSSSNTSNDGTPGFDPSDILAAGSGPTGDITFNHNGYLTDATGTVFFPDAALGVGATVWFEVAGWTGNGVNSYPGTGAGTYGITGPFSEPLSSSQAAAQQTLSNMPTLNLVTVAVPEPSTLAMAGVGLASMLLLRRKTK